MKIIVTNNQKLLEFPHICKTRLELFHKLKKEYSQKVNGFYQLNSEIVFVEFDEVDNNWNFSEIKDKDILMELSFWKLYKKAVAFAPEKHGQQKYGGFLPYAYHLKQTDKVIDAFAEEIPLGNFFKLKTACWLHDVLEDTPINFEQLSREFTPEIADIVLRVTKINEDNTIEFEKSYYENMAKNPLAVYVKIADKSANAKQTIKDKSVWHAQRLVKGHVLFQKCTYGQIKADKMKNYLDNLIKKLEKISYEKNA